MLVCGVNVGHTAGRACIMGGETSDIVGEALYLEIILSPELKIGEKAMLGHSFLFLASPAMTPLHH